MRTLTYTGRARYRALGPDDGMTRDLRFERGVPLEVADENADAILGNPELYPGFAEGETTDAGDADDTDDTDAGDAG